MKKVFLIGSVCCAALLTSYFMSCSKKSDSKPAPTYSCASCNTTPEAVAANDASTKGIYKGVIVGSSGTIKFDIMNHDSTIKAYLVIDGAYDTLTASVAWSGTGSYVSPFTGIFNGQPISITLSIDAGGGNPVITAMNIPGHPGAQLSLSKETSTELIKCFEGLVRQNGSTDTGTFNLILSTKLGKWGAIVAGGSTTKGTFSGSTLTFDDGNGTAGSATLSGDNIINGTWHNNKSESGTWSGKRTL
jgi:hypothetical protein